jgi:hypothetical protein
MTASTGKSDNAWRELTFCVCLIAVSALLLIEGLGASIDEDSVLNARALPATLSAVVLVYAALRGVSVMRQAYGSPIPRPQLDGLTIRIVVPLSAAMVLYVWLVQAIGYPGATALTMVWVFWIFGVRRVVPNLALSGASAVVSTFLFVTLLGMYMPEGWLLEWVLEAVASR